MSWLSDRWDDPNGVNRAKWKKVRDDEITTVKDHGMMGTFRRRVKADDALIAQRQEQEREAARPEPGPIMRVRDVLNGGVNASLMGLAMIAAVATTDPDSHDSIKAGFQSAFDTVQEIGGDLRSIKNSITFDSNLPQIE